MVLLGVILVLLAAAAGVVLIAGTAQLTDSVEIDLLGGTLSIPPLTLLVTGMVVISVFWLGWVLLRSGLRRGRRQRVAAKEAAAAAEARRVEQAQEQTRLQDEFTAREKALVEERRLREEAEARAAGPSTSPATGSAVHTAGGTGTGTGTGEPGTGTGTGTGTGEPDHTAVDERRVTDTDRARDTRNEPTRDASDLDPRHSERRA